MAQQHPEHDVVRLARAAVAHARAAAALSSPNGPLVYYVLGNEAADLDSVVSALALAVLRTALVSHMHHVYRLNDSTDQESIPEAQAPSAVFVPVVAILRRDFTLRTDASHALRSFLAVAAPSLSLRDFVQSCLLFADDLPNVVRDSSQILPIDPWFRLILVDHNTLPPTLAHLQHLVVSVVDHHVDDRNNTDLPDDKIELTPRNSQTDPSSLTTNVSFQQFMHATTMRGPRVIVPAGSCSTIVMQQYSLFADKLCDDSADSWGFEWWFLRNPTQRRTFLRYLILPTILVDTACLSPIVARATPLDHKAIDQWILPHLFSQITQHQQTINLSSSTNDDPRESFMQHVFSDIMDAKQTVDGLTDIDLFRRDYKEFTVPKASEILGSSMESLSTVATNGITDIVRFGISSVQWSLRDRAFTKPNFHQSKFLPGWINMRVRVPGSSEGNNDQSLATISPLDIANSSASSKGWAQLLRNSLVFSASSNITPDVLSTSVVKVTALNNEHSGSSKVPIVDPSISESVSTLENVLKLETGDSRAISPTNAVELDLHIIMTAYEHSPEDEISDSDDEHITTAQSKSLIAHGFQREFLVIIPPWSKIPDLVSRAAANGKISSRKSGSSSSSKQPDIFSILEGKHVIAGYNPTTSKTIPSPSDAQFLPFVSLTPRVTEGNMAVASAKCFIQRQTKLSRKQIQPLISELLRALRAAA